MIPTLDDLRKETHKTTIILRQIDRLIESSKFDDAWKLLEDDQKLVIVNAVSWHDKQTIINVLKQSKEKELGLRGIRDLRALAHKRGLVGYMGMSKATLLSELAKLEDVNYDEE